MHAASLLGVVRLASVDGPELGGLLAGCAACGASAVALGILWAHFRRQGSSEPLTHSPRPSRARRAAQQWLPIIAAAVFLGAALALLAQGKPTRRAGGLATHTVVGPLDPAPDVVISSSTAVAGTEAAIDSVVHAHSIFVSIASYRDLECPATLQSLFTEADLPQRVFVAVVEQNAWRNESCLLGVEARWLPHVQVLTLPHTESRGPTWARFLASRLYRGERYYLQLDSHSRFLAGWDSGFIDMLGRAGGQRPALTVYPPPWPNAVHDIGVISVLCASHWSGNGILAPLVEGVPTSSPPRPRPVPFIAAGFFFTRGEAVTEVPFDPDLPDLFVGEEILHAARLWTSGWNFFSPDTNFVFHQYVEESNKVAMSRPKYWHESKVWYNRREVSDLKVRYLLGWTSVRPVGRGLGIKYGLGRQRTLEAYWDYAGVDVHNHSGTRSRSKFCPELT